MWDIIMPLYCKWSRKSIALVRLLFLMCFWWFTTKNQEISSCTMGLFTQATKELKETCMFRFSWSSWTLVRTKFWLTANKYIWRRHARIEVTLPTLTWSILYLMSMLMWSEVRLPCISQPQRIYKTLVTILDQKYTRARYFVSMGAHLVYIGHPYIPNGCPWAQNVWLWSIHMP